MEEKLLPIEIDPELLRVYNEYEKAQALYQESFSDPDYKNKRIAIIVTFILTILAVIFIFIVRSDEIFWKNIFFILLAMSCTSLGFAVYYIWKEISREAHFERMSHDKVLNAKHKLAMMIVTFNEIIGLSREYDVQVFSQRRENLLRLAIQLKMAEECGENLDQVLEAIRYEFVFGQKMLIQSYLAMNHP